MWTKSQTTVALANVIRCNFFFCCCVTLRFIPSLCLCASHARERLFHSTEFNLPLRPIYVPLTIKCWLYWRVFKSGNLIRYTKQDTLKYYSALMLYILLLHFDFDVIIQLICIAFNFTFSSKRIQVSLSFSAVHIRTKCAHTLKFASNQIFSWIFISDLARFHFCFLFFFSSSI